MFEKLNLNWSAVWRKGAVGAVLTALMGYTYKVNKDVDAAIDQQYPKPSEQNKDENDS